MERQHPETWLAEIGGQLVDGSSCGYYDKLRHVQYTAWPAEEVNMPASFYAKQRIKRLVEGAIPLLEVRLVAPAANNHPPELYRPCTSNPDGMSS